MANQIRNARVIREGAGGFLNPPGHPEHSYSVETDLRRRPENRGTVSLLTAVSEEYSTGPGRFDAETRRQVFHLLAQWEAEKLPLDSYECRLWVRRVWAHLARCWAVETTENYGDGPHICYPRPVYPAPIMVTDEHSDAYAYTFGVDSRGNPKRPPSGEWCDAAPHDPETASAVVLIRRFYPEYIEGPWDRDADCLECGHHVNAHANGEGGPCTVILGGPNPDRGHVYAADELCECAAFVPSGTCAFCGAVMRDGDRADECGHAEGIGGASGGIG